MQKIETEIVNKEEDLYLSLVYYRLVKDIEIIDEKINNNAPKDVSNETNVFKREWAKNIINPIRKNKVDDLSDDKKAASDNLDAFKEKYGDKYNHTIVELKAMRDEVFKSDKLNEAKMMLSFRLILSNEYKLINPKDTLKDLSLVLYDNEEKLPELYKELKENYLALNKKELENVEKSILVGLGVVTAATLVVVPVGLTFAAISSTATAAALGGMVGAGASMAGAGIGTITASLIASELLLTGLTFGGLSLYEIRKNEELKKKFREITPEDLAMKLTIKATLIQEISKVSKDNEVVDYIDDALKVLDDYRADAEYMLIVEKLDAKNAKKKIEVCNNLSLRLAEIVGI